MLTRCQINFPENVELIFMAFQMGVEKDLLCFCCESFYLVYVFLTVKTSLGFNWQRNSSSFKAYWISFPLKTSNIQRGNDKFQADKLMNPASSCNYHEKNWIFIKRLQMSHQWQTNCSLKSEKISLNCNFPMTMENTMKIFHNLL